MKIRRPLLTSVLSVLLLVAMVPMQADTYGWTPAGDTFKTSVKFERAFLVDGGARFEPGRYDVVVQSLGDGSVRTTFTGNGKVGYATGKGIWGKGNAASRAQIGQIKAAPAGNHDQPNTVPSFASLGFTTQSPASFQQVGNQMNLLLKGNGNNQILIGLLVPAVQKIREAASRPAK